MFLQALRYSLLLALLLKSSGLMAEELSVDQRYQELIRAERERTSKNSIYPNLISGLAAFGIGTWGYYNDNRGVLTRLVYSGTQTAGILIASDAIFEANQPSLLLLTDKYLRERGTMRLPQYKRGIVEVQERSKLAKMRQLAYTSAILATMYTFQGAQEQKRAPALGNVFYFLGFNFTLISAANFYKLYHFDAPTSTMPEEGLSLELTPLPTLSYRF